MILNKKVIRYALIIVLLIALGGCAFGAYVGGRVWVNLLPLEDEYESIYSREQYSLTVDESGRLDVLKINDTHFVNGKTEEDVKTLKGIEVALAQREFDFIVLDGDIIDGFNLNPRYDKEGAIISIAELIEKYDTPWTFVPGNNDGEIDGSTRDVIAYMLRYENFVAGNVEGIYGDLQFYVDVKFSGQSVHTLAFMDTGMRKPKITGKYDHVRENQIKHLKEEINARGVKTSLFMHMQTPAFEEAYKLGEYYANIPNRCSDAYSSIPKNSLFDKEMEDVELLTLVSCGHQHGNSLCSYYDNRYYELASPSGYSAWMPDGVNPTLTVISINVLLENVKDIYQFEKILV